MKIDSSRTRFLILSIASSAAIVFNGCDSHDEGGDAATHSSPYPACNEIIEACHAFDIGEGPLHDCHNTAHEAKSEAPCTPIRENCVKICAEANADAGAKVDGG